MKTIHIFCKFKNPYGGAEAEALQLFELLRKKRDVRLWALSKSASATLLNQYPIRRVSSAHLALPDGGTYIFVCHHWRKGLWRFLARKPMRLIYIYNIFHPSITAHTQKSPPGWPPVEYVFVSDFQRRILGLSGEVHASPIDIQRFVPTTRSPGDHLVIGRLSRDTPDKYHADDFQIFADLVRGGCKVRLQGGTCLQQQLNGSGVELLEAGHYPAVQFLQDLDIFYFRTALPETFGRVVFEAMACGLPVVCHSHGGYANWIRHGENGYLFDTSNQARDILDQLIADTALRKRIGFNARKTVEDMYSEQAQEQRLMFYLR